MSVAGTVSSRQTMVCGVPQGSSLWALAVPSVTLMIRPTHITEHFYTTFTSVLPPVA